ncbi:long-chain fatty acid--CoA ligase [Actinomadura sp. B10D3]|uniref:long-chain-fatty-acid--CoA ligase n=1 Tax=Actinomadura sp. B10D3 TaxID=3153557 RepID=UPI00325E8A09
MNHNLFGLFAGSAAARPDRAAFRFGDEEVTYGELDALTAHAAGMLRAAGIGAGDRVAVMVPNHPAFAVAYYGALRAGAIVVPMNPLLKGREIRYHLSDPGVKVIFAWHTCREEVTAGTDGLDVTTVFVAPGFFEALTAQQTPYLGVADREPRDTAVILYTSGTTGRPKGAELTHANLTRNAESGARLFGLTGEDVVLGALPLFHSFGQTCGLNALLASGGLLSLVSRFEPGLVLKTIDEHRATVFMGVPTMYNALLHHPERDRFDVSRLRLCVSGGAALPAEILRGFESGFGCALLEGYGLSETSPIASFNLPEAKRPGSIGLPIAGTEMRVVDEKGTEVPAGTVGELAVRGHNVMKGYWRRPEATAEVLDTDGWFRTGDLGRVDEDGFFYIVDRKKELIIRGGYNVYPREIEEVLYEHPAVGECAVIGVPHAELGEEIGAAVVLTRPGAVGAGELRAYVRERVAAYKYPRHIWFLDELPKGPTNKILKREIVAPPTTAS